MPELDLVSWVKPWMPSARHRGLTTMRTYFAPMMRNLKRGNELMLFLTWWTVLSEMDNGYCFQSALFHWQRRCSRSCGGRMRWCRPSGKNIAPSRYSLATFVSTASLVLPFRMHQRRPLCGNPYQIYCQAVLLKHVSLHKAHVPGEQFFFFLCFIKQVVSFNDFALNKCLTNGSGIWLFFLIFSFVAKGHMVKRFFVSRNLVIVIGFPSSCWSDCDGFFAKKLFVFIVEAKYFCQS